MIGGGTVATALANRLIELGHEVMMGSRSADGPARAWATGAGQQASAGDFAAAARHGELVINATAGSRSLEALHQAGEANLAGKVLIQPDRHRQRERGPGHVDGRQHRQPR